MFYDTLTQQRFTLPTDKSTPLPMYVCGLTVYDYAHLGHARMFITFDMFRRGLLHQHYQPYFIQNITDIDDKILNKMVQQDVTKLEDITQPYIQAMHEDRATLNIMVPDTETQATHFIPAMLELIERLLHKGYAYVSDTGVQFRDPNNDDVDSHFSLWKFSKDGERVSYPSPWGAGRPGWHIECSAMIHAVMGDTPLWMHGGGQDLHFPHHHNERLQSETAYGHPLAHHWMHNGFIRVNQEKMSKSLGNFFTIREVLKEVSPGALRYYISKTHYRDHLEYSDTTLQNAEREWRRMVNVFIDGNSTDGWNDPEHETVFNDAFNDDMNVTRMWHFIHQWLSQGLFGSAWQGLRYFGLDTLIERERRIPEEIREWATLRAMAKQERNWAVSDLWRSRIQERGFEVLDLKEGYRVVLR